MERRFLLGLSLLSSFSDSTPAEPPLLTTAASDAPSTLDARSDCNERLIRRLSGRYFLVLLAVAALVVADQMIVQPLLGRMNAYAPTINLAGRQRMLSQRLTKAALALVVATDEPARERYREEL